MAKRKLSQADIGEARTQGLNPDGLIRLKKVIEEDTANTIQRDALKI